MSRDMEEVTGRRTMTVKMLAVQSETLLTLSRRADIMREHRRKL